ncbi:MAG TPA: response regulator transcription factor [Actinomycetota bacterium]|nr:response regulator transcription factor [Actinomycetota bacterium]
MAIKVVVVDDTDHVRRMLCEMLQLDGFEVVGEASNGSEAIEKTAQTTPDVVVMDYKMPEMDGLTAATRIREANADQGIVLYSAYLDEEVEQKAREAGIAMCIGKVEGLNQLERHLTEICRDLASS